ncbi:hypothetical protein GCM10009541_59930 [Micromonospora gifhornensis]|uniref:Uncharacterized protein n=1 Tax=Micromonospora gifhornensis TaxID=84594 RepID=A0ABQ4IHJ5_9ACTN|nr:hypothetical protein Vgi01_40690 [Micromonospora gifhornensis]
MKIVTALVPKAGRQRPDTDAQPTDPNPHPPSLPPLTLTPHTQRAATGGDLPRRSCTSGRRFHPLHPLCPDQNSMIDEQGWGARGAGRGVLGGGRG